MRPGPGPARPVLLVVRTVHFAFVHDSLGAPFLGRDLVLQLLCCLLHCSNPRQKQKPYRVFFFIISFSLDTLFDVRLGISFIYEPKHA